MGETRNARLTFPDLPRMELDQLLGQLVERAEEVMATQGRLRGLLKANRIVTGDLALPTLLRRIIEAARDLIGARYAALGVLGPDGRLAEFVHTGMDPETVAKVGDLPAGKGLLGALIDDPRPIRLARISDDPRSSGFPEQHPPMDSFLGVPILIRDTVFGNLYLTECDHGEFTGEDEELALALAATAGQAIENARLYATSRKQQEWLQATAAITRDLITPGKDRPLRAIAGYTRDLAEADLVAILRPSRRRDCLRVDVAVGDQADRIAGRDIPLNTTLIGEVYQSGVPRAGSWQDQQSAEIASLVRVDAVLAVPLTGDNGVNGVLTGARAPGRPGFSDEDLTMAAAFAAQASVSQSLAGARAEQQRNELLEDRDRIAARLHEHVINRVYAVGLSLHTTLAHAKSPLVAQRLQAAISELDDVTLQIQDAVLQLDDLPNRGGQPLRERIQHLLDETATSHTVSTHFSGKLNQITGQLADDLLTALRKGLLVGAAGNDPAEVEVTIDEERVLLKVTSARAGGFDPAEADRVRALAERNGGTADITPTGMTWTVPGPATTR
ncbi:GAF domain-containing protein [Amycolatopsis benzoatilytica]|uniref:GAF domain-containing protein n=1 Tax=Amycolatopsis benzoatilytica TaxID=346045 RepID=UPI0003772C3A|nr:GAF domain-containing protein [Amycolatopsis benzoatilytica]